MGVTQSSLKDLKAHYVGLANPTRLAILSLLVSGEMAAAEVARKLKLSQPLLSWHLRVMRRAGLLRTARSGREVRLTINRKLIHDYQQRFNEIIGVTSGTASALATSEAGVLEQSEIKEIASAI